MLLLKLVLCGVDDGPHSMMQAVVVVALTFVFLVVVILTGVPGSVVAFGVGVGVGVDVAAFRCSVSRCRNRANQ